MGITIFDIDGIPDPSPGDPPPGSGLTFYDTIYFYYPMTGGIFIHFIGKVQHHIANDDPGQQETTLSGRLKQRAWPLLTADVSGTKVAAGRSRSESKYTILSDGDDEWTSTRPPGT